MNINLSDEHALILLQLANRLPDGNRFINGDETYALKLLAIKIAAEVDNDAYNPDEDGEHAPLPDPVTPSDCVEIGGKLEQL